MYDLLPFGTGESDFARYLDDLEKGLLHGMSSLFSPLKADIADHGSYYTLKAELPGFTKDEVEVILNGRTLTVSAKQDRIIEEENGDFLRKERKLGSLSRSFDMTGIQTNQITADYRNGILELTLPKETPAADTFRKIDIK